MQLADAAAKLDAVLLGGDVSFRGCSIDSRSIRDGEMFIALRGARFDGHDFLPQARAGGACAALVEEEVTRQLLPLLVVKDSRAAMGRLAQHRRNDFDIPVVAITGSNGKTTVKEMLAAILAQQAPVLSTPGNLNNEIGVPLTLFGLGSEHRYGVIEMGANHAGEIAVLSHITRPTVALITQCAPAHLEGFGSIAGVARAKAEIFQGLAANGTAIINADDAYADFWRTQAGNRRQISFGLTGAADVHATHIVADPHGGQSRFVLVNRDAATEIRLPLPGMHNIVNALAAAACCRALEIPAALIKSGLESLQPVRGRLQIRRGQDGTRIFDDTYNANPASLRAALEVLREEPGRKWLVLGDMGELGAGARDLHSNAGELARQHGVERLYGLGSLSGQAVRAFGNGARLFADAERLLGSLRADLEPGVTILVKGSRAMNMEHIVSGLLEEQ